MEKTKLEPKLKLPLEKGEKVIQISSAAKEGSYSGNFNCLTNRGRVFFIYGSYDNSTVSYFEGYKYELVI